MPFDCATLPSSVAAAGNLCSTTPLMPTAAHLSNSSNSITTTAALASAEATAKQPADPKTDTTAIRTLRHTIQTLAVPEAKTEVLYLFDLEKWLAASRGIVNGV